MNVTSGLNRCAIFVVGTLGLNLRSQVVCLDRDINPDVQMLTANAWKRTGSFAPVVSTDNVQSGVESGRFELDLKLNDIDLAALSSD